MFAKQDKYFDDLAADPVRRRQAIEDMSRRRNILLCCAVVTSLCALVIFFSASGHSIAPAAIGFGAAIHWMITFRLESDLSLLRTVERLQGSRDDKLAG